MNKNVSLEQIVNELSAVTTADEFKKVARKYYNDGCDEFIECYEDRQLEELIGKRSTIEMLVDCRREENAMCENGAGWFW